MRVHLLITPCMAMNAPLCRAEIQPPAARETGGQADTYKVLSAGEFALVCSINQDAMQRLQLAGCSLTELDLSGKM